MLHLRTMAIFKITATMKNIFKCLMLVAVAAMAFVACQNEPEDINVTAKQVTVNISGDLVDTRSYFGEPDETAKTYPSKWAGGETVAFSLNEAALVEATNTGTGSRATFSVALADDHTTEGTIYAFSPKGVFNGSSATNNEGGFTGLNTKYQDAFVVIPEVQNPTTTSVDPSVHLLAGAYSYTDGLPTAVNMQFKHVAAYAKMTIKDFIGVIEKVEVTASAPLAGSSCWYYYAGEKDGQLTNADKTTITVMNPAESNYDFWFGCAPADLKSGTLSVKVYAANGDTYTKALDIAGHDFAFHQGGVSRFTVSINAENKDEAEEEIVGDFKLVKSLSELTDGEYVIAAKSGGVYYAMSNTIEPKIDGVEVAVVNETIASADAEGYVYKIDNTGSAFTIQSVSDSKYLKYASNTDIGSQTTAYNWTIMEGTNGTFRLVSGTSGRGLIYRGSTTNRFGGYALSNATATSTQYYDIELFKRTAESGGGEEPEGPEQLAKPTNLVESNVTSESFTISWSAVANASSYAVSLNGATPQSVNGTSCSFTGLDAETPYTVSVVAKGDGVNYADSMAATLTIETAEDPNATQLIPDGDYVIIASNANKDSYFALSSTASGSRLASVDVVCEEGATSFVTPDETLIWTIKATDGGYNIISSGGNYLHWTSDNSANTSESAESVVDIKESATAGRYNIIWGKDATRLLARNQQNAYFAFYTGSGYKDLLIIPAEQGEVVAQKLATPENLKATAVSTTVSVTWNAVQHADGYAVTCGDVTKNTTSTSCEFANLDPTTTYMVSVVAKGDGTYYSDSDAATTPVTTGESQQTGGAGSVTFDFSKGETALAITPITITKNSSTGWRDESFRINSGAGANAIVLTADSGYNITKIEFTYTGTSYNGALSTTTGTYTLSSTSATWTGSSSSVSFKNGSKQARIKKLVVTYEN